MNEQVAEYSFQEIREMFAEIARRFQDTDKRFQDTERLLKESSQEMDKRFQDTDKKFQETERLLKEMSQETDKEIKELRKSIGEITGKWSRFVEGMVAPGVERLFGERGIKVKRIYQRVRNNENGGMEIDILAIDSEYAILVEAKSTLSVDDVREHLERLEKFKSMFPEYKDRKVIGAVAGIVIDEGADKFAYRKGLFVIAQSGDTIKFLNDEKFKPAIW